MNRKFCPTAVSKMNLFQSVVKALIQYGLTTHPHLLRLYHLTRKYILEAVEVFFAGTRTV